MKILTCDNCGYLLNIHKIEKLPVTPLYCYIYKTYPFYIMEGTHLRPSQCNIKRNLFTIYRSDKAISWDR